MSSISWAGAVSGDWATGANWSGGIAPGANDDVTIGLSGAFTVDITTAVAARTLTLNNPGATVLDTGSLTLTGALTLTAGTFNLGTGGALVGGTIVDNNSDLFCAGGTLNGVTYQGQLNLLSGGQSVTIVNGITLSGVGGVGQANVNTNHATINFQGTQTLDNAQVSLSLSTINVTDLNGAGAILTIGANTIVGSFNVTGNSISDAGGAGDGIDNLGQIQVGAGSITVNGNSFVNGGTVEVENAPSAHLVFNSSSFTNTGTIGASGGGMLQFLDASFVNDGQITLSGTTQLTIGKTGSSWTNANGAITLSGGVLLLDGNFTAANLGTIGGSGGTLSILGNLDNSSGNLSTGTGTSAFSALTVKGSIKNGLVNGPSRQWDRDGRRHAGRCDLSGQSGLKRLGRDRHDPARHHPVRRRRHRQVDDRADRQRQRVVYRRQCHTHQCGDQHPVARNKVASATDQAATGAVLDDGPRKPRSRITQTGSHGIDRRRQWCVATGSSSRAA